jgi:hypothetical protein
MAACRAVRNILMRLQYCLERNPSPNLGRGRGEGVSVPQAHAEIPSPNINPNMAEVREGKPRFGVRQLSLASPTPARPMLGAGEIKLECVSAIALSRFGR